MFSGSWKESGMDTIELEIPDQNIDIEEAHFFNKMRKEANVVLQIWTIGYMCLEWLLNNLMTHQSVELLKELSINLMKQLISSSNLFVMQVEMDIYTALKKWMFLHLVPSWNGPLKQLLSEADAWFSKRRKGLYEVLDFEDGISFLETEQGYAFIPVFKYLRLQYIVSDLASARIIERDSLIPADWLFSVYKQQWFAMLRAEQDNDIGPQEINKEELEANSMRCGRKLAKDGDYCWRWTGFNFGFDLLVTYTNRYIIFKRNTLNQPCSGSVSLQPQRSIAFRWVPSLVGPVLRGEEVREAQLFL
ncbi:putative Germ cell-less protein [Naja naja]|nr:putative Germ cell-less protein [Naja naja]